MEAQQAIATLNVPTLAYDWDYVELEWFQVLPQVRQHYDQAALGILAANIARLGVLQPQMVAVLSSSTCEHYLEVFNFIFESSLCRADLTRAPDGYYYIVIAGHRRVLAQRMLGHKQSFVRLYREIDPQQAITLQISENLYQHPAPEDEAEVFYQLYRLAYRDDAKLSPTRFARENRVLLGKSEQAIYQAIRFCELPPEIVAMVHCGAIAYGVAIQLTRLRQYLTGDELVDTAKRAFLSQQTVREFKRVVDGVLFARKSNQLDLLFETVAQADARKRAERRYLLDRGLVNALKVSQRFLSHLSYLTEQGILTLEEWPRDTSLIFELILENQQLADRLIGLLK